VLGGRGRVGCGHAQSIVWWRALEHELGV